MSKAEREIYFDHAATTPLDKDVFEIMRPYYTELFGNPDSPHGIGRTAMRAVDEARDKLAALLGAKSSEIYFTSGGTESDNWAVLGGAYAAREKGKTHVILSSVEHHAVLSAGERLEKEGFSVTYLPVNRQGRVEASSLREALTPDTGLVGVMAANNETGVVQPFKELAKLAHENGSLFFTDAVQAAPYLPIDVREWGADMLSFSAHKFYGPKGCGALYVGSGVKIGRLIAGGEQERGLRGGTVNVPAVAGLAAAYEKSARDRAANNEKTGALRDLFLKEIFSGLENVKLNGDAENSLPGIVNLCFEGIDNAAFLYNMDLRGVAVSAGSACASASVKPSHVLTAMGLSEREARASVRLSFGKDNTAEEVLYGAALTKEIVGALRGFGEN